MPHPLSVSDANFYQRPSIDIARRLVGERVILADGTQADLTIVRAYDGLKRKEMKQVFGSKNRKPGDITVTHTKQPMTVIQLNVTGVHPSDPALKNPDFAQLTWLTEMEEPGSETLLANPTVIKRIAAAQDETVTSTNDALDFAMAHIDGSNVQDSDAPLRIVPNGVRPYNAEHVAFLEHQEGPVNEVAVGILQSGPVNMPDNVVEAALRSQLPLLAKKLKNPAMTYDDLIAALRDPSKAVAVIKASKLIRGMIARAHHFARREEKSDSAAAAD